MHTECYYSSFREERLTLAERGKIDVFKINDDDDDDEWRMFIDLQLDYATGLTFFQQSQGCQIINQIYVENADKLRSALVLTDPIPDLEIFKDANMIYQNLMQRKKNRNISIAEVSTIPFHSTNFILLC